MRLTTVWYVVVILFFLSCAVEGHEVNLLIPSADFFIESGLKGHKITQQECQAIFGPGKPDLPGRRLFILLPPGASNVRVEFQPEGSHVLPGNYKIEAAPVPIPLLPDGRGEKLQATLSAEWSETYRSIYTKDNPYPGTCGHYVGMGTLRKYIYCELLLFPFSYRPLSGKIIRREAIRATVSYSLPELNSRVNEPDRGFHWDTSVDMYAARLFYNYAEIAPLYSSTTRNGSPERSQLYDYLIITTDAHVGAINASQFISWKTSLGHSVRLVTITDPEISGQPGSDLPAKIRNFLRENYQAWSIQYVMIVGHHSTIPMRYCFPNPNNHVDHAGTPDATSGEQPTDFYYADLSFPDAVSWDLDGDGYFGEYGQDAPDFLAEVVVGRIPTDNDARITGTLDKLVAFEQDCGDWKNHALHAGAFWYLSNENNNGKPAYDGACCMHEMERNLMTGWSITHFSEQNGLEHSDYAWPALTAAAFANAWRNGSFAVVNWGAHGWPDGAARKVWAWDDGDGVPETSNPNELSWPYFISLSSSLDADFPSILFAISCMIGYPESNVYGNIGIDLLTHPTYGSGCAILGASRIAYGQSGWPKNPGGSESLCYEFNRYLINGPDGPEKVGEALYHSKAYYHLNYGIAHFVEHWNLFNYNLFGDPSLSREGLNPAQVPAIGFPGYALIVLLLSVLIVQAGHNLGKGRRE